MEHRVYFKNANLVRRGIEYWHTGARHYFYTRVVPERVVHVMLERCRAYASDTGVEWSLAWEKDDHVQVFTHDGEHTAPLWRMDSRDLQKLVEAVDTAPTEIFVERFVDGGLYMRNQEYPFYLNLYEAADKFRNIRFTVFGKQYWDMWFRSPLRGCVVTAIKVGDYKVTGAINRVMPDSYKSYASPMYRAVREAAKDRARELDKYKTGVVTSANCVNALVVTAVMGFLLTPEYERRVRGIKYRQSFNPLDMLPPGTYKREEWDHPDYYRKLPAKRWLKNGDGLLCDTCTLKYRCPLYQPGSVCGVPKSEGKALADFFDSRNSDDVLTGLQSVLKKQAERVEGAVAAEDQVNATRIQEDKPAIYSEQVTKMLDSVQRNAERYLKLIDPRFAKPLIQIGQMNVPHALDQAQPREIDPAQAKRELVELGMPPEAVTADHIERYLSGEWNGPREQAQLQQRRHPANQIIDAETGPTSETEQAESGEAFPYF